MNNTQLIDLSVEETLTVAGGEDKLTCFVLGAVFAGGLLSGPGGWLGSLWAADSARREGCLD